MTGSVDLMKGSGQPPLPRGREGGHVAYTSSRAYRDAVLSGRTQTRRGRVLECIRASAVPLTRRQVAQLTEIPINVVCPAVFTLLRDGLIRIGFEDEDQGTKARAQFLEAVTPAPVQRQFAWPGVGGRSG